MSAILGTMLEAGGLFALICLLYLVVLIVGGFVSAILESIDPTDWDDPWVDNGIEFWSVDPDDWDDPWVDNGIKFGNVDPDDWDDPWVDNGIEFGNLLPERPGTIADSLPMVQLNRRTGQYDIILGGYLKEEGGDN